MALLLEMIVVATGCGLRASADDRPSPVIGPRVGPENARRQRNVLRFESRPSVLDLAVHISSRLDGN
jgi:hypothetical protein